jgi:hypothetical protein
MVPFLKASAEINAAKAKALAEDLKRLGSYSAANDDKYSQIYYGAQETKASNE